MPRCMVMGHNNPRVERRGHSNSRPLMKHSFHGFFNSLGIFSVFSAIVLLCWISVSLISRILQDIRLLSVSQIDTKELWEGRPSNGWRPSSIAEDEWILPSSENNGFLLIRCNGGLNEHRIAISNAVLTAKIMNATLVLPELDTNTLWPDDKSSFSDIYDVEHFIKSLENDVEIVRTSPRIRTVGYKRKPLRPFQLQPPKDASLDWYQTVAVEKMKEHGAIYLMMDVSNQLAEDVPIERQYQKLRCRVNFHALRFNEEVRQLSSRIVTHLRSNGSFMAIHFPSDMEILSSEGCLSVFTSQEQEILKNYEKNLKIPRAYGKSNRRCPLTPREVGLILQSMGFSNSTMIYVAGGAIFREETFMQTLRSKFSHLETRSSIVTTVDGLVEINTSGKTLLGAAVDYMVFLMADIFMPTYEDFGISLIGHRLYNGFRTSIQLNLKVLGPRNPRNFETKLRWLFQGSQFGDLHNRGARESFYTNPWPQCFCKKDSKSQDERCFQSKMLDLFSWELSEDSGKINGSLI